MRKGKFNQAPKGKKKNKYKAVLDADPRLVSSVDLQLPSYDLQRKGFDQLHFVSINQIDLYLTTQNCSSQTTSLPPIAVA